MVWASNDTILYSEQVIFPFEFVDEAESYIVQSCQALFSLVCEINLFLYMNHDSFYMIFQGLRGQA